MPFVCHICWLYLMDLMLIWIVMPVVPSEPAATVENQQIEDPPISRFTWTIENLSRVSTKKLYSEIFVVGGYKWWVPTASFVWVCVLCWFLPIEGVTVRWLMESRFVCRRILIFPRGNNVEYLSMYLDVADSAVLPYGWTRYAQFSLSVVNQMHNKFTIRKGAFIIYAFFFI